MDVLRREFPNAQFWDIRKLMFAESEHFGFTLTSQFFEIDIAGGITLSDDNATASEMGGILVQTGAVSGDGGQIGAANGYIQLAANTRLIYRTKQVESTSKRWFGGIDNGTTTADAIPPAGNHAAGFCIRTASSSNFRIVTSNGTTSTEVDYSPAVAVDTNWHTFQIWRDGTNVNFKIDDNATHSTSTTLPGSTNAVYPMWGIQTVTGALRSFNNSFWRVFRTSMGR